MSRNARCCYRVAAGALAIVASLILTSCSSESAGVHLQTPDPPSSSPVDLSSSAAGTKTIPSQPVVSSTPTSTAGTARPSSSSTTTAATNRVNATTSTSADPWPKDFTLAQQAAAKASLAAVQSYIRVEAEANAKPGAKDWTKEVRKYTADPAAYQALKGISSLAAARVHATVPPTYEAFAVKSADGRRVVITACIDASKADLVDASGKSVLTPSAHPRSIKQFTISLFAAKDGGWLVSNTTLSNPAKIC